MTAKPIRMRATERGYDGTRIIQEGEEFTWTPPAFDDEKRQGKAKPPKWAEPVEAQVQEPSSRRSPPKKTGEE